MTVVQRGQMKQNRVNAKYIWVDKLKEVNKVNKSLFLTGVAMRSERFRNVIYLEGTYFLIFINTVCLYKMVGEI